MGYSRKNRLHRIVDVQNITLEHTRQYGSTQEWIYNNLIYPKYRISRTTYYIYLTTNAKAELTKINECGE